MTSVSAQPAPEELTLAQIREKHPNMWVAMLVTKRDKNRQPIAGKVVAEDVDRYRLREALYSYKDVCIFFAGESQFPLFL